MTELDLDVARQILAAQPFSRLLGAELTDFGDGRAELVVALDQRLRQQDGVAHGGVIAYAADNALTFAAGSAVGPAVWTAEMKVNYLRGARGEELIARAEVVHAGSRLVVARCDLFDRAGGDERRCAAAQGTIALRGPGASA